MKPDEVKIGNLLFERSGPIQAFVSAGEEPLGLLEPVFEKDWDSLVEAAAKLEGNKSED